MDAPLTFDVPPAPRVPGQPYDQPPMPARERRLHARAYRHWASLRGARRLPCIAELDPRDLGEFALHGMLVELGRDARPPVIHFLGQAIAAEAGIAVGARAVDALPREGLLGQLLRRLPTVRDRAAPLSFEADFLGGDGAPTHYRGILLPFVDDAGVIAHVFGVISWKLVAAEAIDADVAASLGAALTLTPRAFAPSAWAARPAGATGPLPLAQQLAAARTWAALGAADRGRRAASVAAALSAAHDLRIAADVDPVGFASLAAETATTSTDTIGAIVRLVFGGDASRTDRARHMAVLAHARRLGIGPGMLSSLLERHPGGAAALAAAERRARRHERGGATAALDTASASGRIAFAAVDADHLLLLARRGPRPADHAARIVEGGGAHVGPAGLRLAAH